MIIRKFCKRLDTAYSIALSLKDTCSLVTVRYYTYNYCVTNTTRTINPNLIVLSFYQQNLEYDNRSDFPAVCTILS